MQHTTSVAYMVAVMTLLLLLPMLGQLLLSMRTVLLWWGLMMLRGWLLKLLLWRWLLKLLLFKLKKI
jgi:hypothetical protein